MKPFDPRTSVINPLNSPFCRPSTALHFVVSRCYCLLRAFVLPAFLNTADLAVSVKYHSKSNTDMEGLMGTERGNSYDKGHELHTHILHLCSWISHMIGQSCFFKAD